MGFFSRLYDRVQELKPRELQQYGDAIPLIIGAFNPIAGAIAGAGRIARRAYEDSRKPTDNKPGPPPPPLDGGGPSDPLPPPMPSGGAPFTQFGGGGSTTGGGIPVALLTQLGSGIRQQSASVRHMLSKAAGARGGRTTQRRRRAKKKAKAPRAKRRKSAGGKRKYNSAAWMAKIRKMRKK